MWPNQKGPARMIDLHYWPTPNGHKITLFLEETGLPYRIVPVNIGHGEQFQPDFLAIPPTTACRRSSTMSRAGGGEPMSVFESGAILLYLAEKTGQFSRPSLRGRAEVLQWLFWQMGGLGPMAGQNHHFAIYAPEKLPYAIDRYVNETNRLYGVLDRRLADRPFVAGADYSIADMASLSVDRALPEPGPEARRLPASRALVRRHRGPAGDASAPMRSAISTAAATPPSTRRRRRSCSARPRPSSAADRPAHPGHAGPGRRVTIGRRGVAGPLPAGPRARFRGKGTATFAGAPAGAIADDARNPMAKVIASSLRKGNVVDMDGKLYVILTAQNIHPGKGTPVTQLDMRRIGDGVKVSERYRTTEQVERAYVEARAHLPLRRRRGLSLHEPGNLRPGVVPKDVVGDQAVYLQEGMVCTVSLPTGWRSRSSCRSGSPSKSSRPSRRPRARRPRRPTSRPCSPTVAHHGAAAYRRRHARGGDDRGRLLRGARQGLRLAPAAAAKPGSSRRYSPGLASASGLCRLVEKGVSYGANGMLCRLHDLLQKPRERSPPPTSAPLNHEDILKARRHAERRPRRGGPDPLPPPRPPGKARQLVDPV